MVLGKEILVIDTIPGHVRELSGNLRIEDQLEAVRLGWEPRKGLFHVYRKALYRKTALIDNRVVAIWGVSGTPMSLTGRPYLMTSPLLEEVPTIRFVKMYREELEVMKRLYNKLENFVDVGYETSVKMLLLAGFDLKGPYMFNGNLFYEFTTPGYV